MTMIPQLEPSLRSESARLLQHVLAPGRIGGNGHESQERFRRMAESAPVLIWAADEKARRTHFNDRWLEFTGHPMDHQVDDGWTRSVHPADRAHIAKVAAESLAAGRSFTVEYRLLRADGAWRWMLDQATPRFAAGGALVGWVGSCLDVTELPRHPVPDEELERQYLEERFRQDQKLESLSVLAGGIAHDFTNLLTIIFGSTEMLQRSLPDSGEARPHLDRIKEATQRASELCQQMLIYSGRERFHVKDLDLSALAEESVPLLQVSVGRNIHLHSDFDPELPAIKGDVSQLRQALLNLVTNAAEAIGDKRGVVSVRTSVMEVDRRTLRRAELGREVSPGSYVFCEVSDTGRGMDEATRARIFDPFFTTKVDGRGLGLAAVKGIVHNHRGAIHVDSAPLAGTTIRVLLPRA